MDSRFFDGPAGRLDARLHGPADGRPLLILHPHPAMGGTMGSRLVYDLAVALGAAGWRAVRFDFRGVGRSAGAYGQGEGEVSDALAVWDRLREETGTVPVVVGYSFGAAVACRLATQRVVPCLVLVACPDEVPLTSLDPFADAPRVRSSVHVIVGSEDPFIAPADTQRLAESFQPPATTTILAGAGHFLEPTHNPRAVAAVLTALKQ
jgi:alpha/beta superfamily hydrolase